MPNVLISDFDGTITEKDFYQLLVERYIPRDAPDYLGLYRMGKMSHFEAMAKYFSHAPTDEASLQQLITDTRPDPRFVESVSKLKAAGWELIIVSAGSSWYIDRILKKVGVNVPVHANPGRIVPRRGLVIERPFDSPFYNEQTGISKRDVVLEALRRGAKVYYAGDGSPDIDPAMLVRPERRFARRYLAEYLGRCREGFNEFETWSEIVDELLR
ncbi:MAG: MtnX-like HAD-IB family phosphatase [Bryobacterales bacterium]|nr:MtnX-like HAD-IB family phosphatase [Bryobacterales bacterium]